MDTRMVIGIFLVMGTMVLTRSRVTPGMRMEFRVYPGVRDRSRSSYTWYRSRVALGTRIVMRYGWPLGTVWDCVGVCGVGTRADLGLGVLVPWGCVGPGGSVHGLRVTSNGSGHVTVPLLWHRLQDEVTLRLEAESNLAAYRQVRAWGRSQLGFPWQWAGMG